MPFSQNFLGSAAVLKRPATRRTFSPPSPLLSVVQSIGYSLPGNRIGQPIANLTDRMTYQSTSARKTVVRY